jgi:hypothetical protein
MLRGVLVVVVVVVVRGLKGVGVIRVVSGALAPAPGWGRGVGGD